MEIGIPFTLKDELRHFQKVIVNDLQGVLMSTSIHQEPKGDARGFVVIVFETAFDLNTTRTLLGRLGTTFELFDDEGERVKRLRRKRHKNKGPYNPK